MRDRKREIVRENAREPHSKEMVFGKTYIVAIKYPFPASDEHQHPRGSPLCKRAKVICKCAARLKGLSLTA
jgi:hypothetical protein